MVSNQEAARRAAMDALDRQQRLGISLTPAQMRQIVLSRDQNLQQQAAQQNPNTDFSKAFRKLNNVGVNSQAERFARRSPGNAATIALMTQTEREKLERTGIVSPRAVDQGKAYVQQNTVSLPTQQRVEVGVVGEKVSYPKGSPGYKNEAFRQYVQSQKSRTGLLPQESIAMPLGFYYQQGAVRQAPTPPKIEPRPGIVGQRVSYPLGTKGYQEEQLRRTLQKANAERMTLGVVGSRSAFYQKRGYAAESPFQRNVRAASTAAGSGFMAFPKFVEGGTEFGMKMYAAEAMPSQKLGVSKFIGRYEEGLRSKAGNQTSPLKSVPYSVGAGGLGTVRFVAEHPISTYATLGVFSFAPKLLGSIAVSTLAIPAFTGRTPQEKLGGTIETATSFGVFYAGMKMKNYVFDPYKDFRFTQTIKDTKLSASRLLPQKSGVTEVDMSPVGVYRGVAIGTAKSRFNKLFGGTIPIKIEVQGSVLLNAQRPGMVQAKIEWGRIFPKQATITQYTRGGIDVSTLKTSRAIVTQEELGSSSGGGMNFENPATMTLRDTRAVSRTFVGAMITDRMATTIKGTSSEISSRIIVNILKPSITGKEKELVNRFDIRDIKTVEEKRAMYGVREYLPTQIVLKKVEKPVSRTEVSYELIAQRVFNEEVMLGQTVTNVRSLNLKETNIIQKHYRQKPTVLAEQFSRVSIMQIEQSRVYPALPSLKALFPSGRKGQFGLLLEKPMEQTIFRQIPQRDFIQQTATIPRVGSKNNEIVFNIPDVTRAMKSRIDIIPSLLSRLGSKSMLKSNVEHEVSRIGREDIKEKSIVEQRFAERFMKARQPIVEQTQIERQIRIPAMMSQQLSKPSQIQVPLRLRISPGRPIFEVPELEIPKISIGRAGGKRDYRSGEEGYNAYVRSGGKLIKVNKEPLTRESALSAGAKVVDESKAAAFTLRKTKEPASDYSDAYYATNRYKFRAKKQNSRIGTEPLYVEKRKYRIDSPGEVSGISAKGWMSSHWKGRSRYSL